MICCCVRNHSKIESPDFPVTGEMPKPQTPILPAHDLGGLSIPQLPWTSPVSFSRYMGISITLPFLERPLRFPSAAFDLADIFWVFFLAMGSVCVTTAGLVESPVNSVQMKSVSSPPTGNSGTEAELRAHLLMSPQNHGVPN